MRTLAAWTVVTAFSSVFAVGADWLSSGGDPQHSGWQKHGKHLTAANAKDLKLLWKRQSDGPSALTAPVIVGPTITHRGMRELVFAGGASDSFYAFDADLGTLFWKVHFESKMRPNCISGWPAPAPVIEPGSDEARDDDEPGPMRPVYFVTSDGRLHAIRPSDGADMTPPVDFLPPGAISSNLNFASNIVYAITSDACQGKPGVWAVNVKTPHARPDFFRAMGSGPNAGVAIGSDGSIYCAIGGKMLSLTSGALRLKDTFIAPEPVSIPPIPFTWQGRELIAAGGRHGLFLLDAAHPDKIAANEPPLDEFAGSLATWQDPAGVRWIYAANASRIVAFKVIGAATKPKLERVWESHEMVVPGSPVVANGQVFALSSGAASTTLFDLDAATGRELYSSRDGVNPHPTELAVANGHVCFGTSDGTLYCFGIPIE